MVEYVILICLIYRPLISICSMHFVHALFLTCCFFFLRTLFPVFPSYTTYLSSCNVESSQVIKFRDTNISVTATHTHARICTDTYIYTHARAFFRIFSGRSTPLTAPSHHFHV